MPRRHPHGHWKTTTFTAGLRRAGRLAPFMLDGPMHGAAFKAYVGQVLVPELKPGDIVVMDNLPAHKIAGGREAVAAAHARLLPAAFRTSIPSKWPSLNLRLCFEKLPPAPSKTSGRPSPSA
jgi:hypothetical protein